MRFLNHCPAAIDQTSTNSDWLITTENFILYNYYDVCDTNEVMKDYCKEIRLRHSRSATHFNTVLQYTRV